MPEAQPDIEVVGEAADGAAVIPLVRQSWPDVVAPDVRMPLLVVGTETVKSHVSAVLAKLGPGTARRR
ncbi:hypothetical protein B1H29_31270 [Streptomyces pactum]|uniref:Uncharacterized protein n=1 Tax=Streptomyces pactum TaxID=68249 RepID=A0A1S6JG94_9ACTN|nr:hypothetical protein B1H29_31270 [Streptomyces pactum]